MVKSRTIGFNMSCFIISCVYCMCFKCCRVFFHSFSWLHLERCHFKSSLLSSITISKGTLKGLLEFFKGIERLCQFRIQHAGSVIVGPCSGCPSAYVCESK